MSEGTISVKGLDKAAVFAALYNRARPQGMGFMHYDPTPMTVEQARQELELGDDNKRMFGFGGRELYFDYVRGRVMKIAIGGNEIDPRLYDRDNGSGAAAEAIASIRDHGMPNDQVVQAGHHLGKQQAANEVYDRFHEENRLTVEGNAASLRLGFSDVADELLPRVRKVTEETDVDDNGE